MMHILFEFRSHILVDIVLEDERSELLLQRLEDDKEHGHHENLQKRTDEHTTDSGRTKRLVTVLSHTRSKHHRQQTDDHSQ